MDYELAANGHTHWLTRIRDYNFYLRFDDQAEVFELFLDSEGETYIGCFDTVEEAKRYTRQWMEETER